jgi:hypothetical protein
MRKKGNYSLLEQTDQIITEETRGTGMEGRCLRQLCWAKPA